MLKEVFVFFLVVCEVLVVVGVDFGLLVGGVFDEFVGELVDFVCLNFLEMGVEVVF